jgi:hypothetical protein
MTWAGHAARRVEISVYILVGKPGGRDNMGDPCVDGRIILKILLK